MDCITGPSEFQPSEQLVKISSKRRKRKRYPPSSNNSIDLLERFSYEGNVTSPTWQVDKP